MTRKTIYPSLLLMALSLSSCGYDGAKAKADRDDWHTQMADSIKSLQKKASADSALLVGARETVGRELENFTIVDNPREVEPYYILSSWKGKYPLSGPGLAARVMKNEGLELIAASRSKFSAIRVSAGDDSATSETVEPDQALNYTAGGLTTVAFTGQKADSIAMIVARHRTEPLKVEFLNPAPVASITLSNDAADMIAATFTLCDAQKQCHLLEKAISIDRRKIEILNLTLQKEQEKNHTKK